MDDNAPNNERGLWIRVGELLAGPNYGSSFTPRIGDEVVIQYLHQDIDCPIITGSVYNGQDLPPFSAGQDSQANHPGVLKGIHGEIHIVAPNQITLMAGDTKIELNGSNVTLSTSGQVDLKGNLKQVAKGLSGGTALPSLPKGRVRPPAPENMPAMRVDYDEQFQLKDETGAPLPQMPYKITASNGVIHRGVTDDEGRTGRIATDQSESVKIEPDLNF